MNGGQCVNMEHGAGYYCLCPDGYSGTQCNATRQEKVMRLSTAALAAILICTFNIIGKFGRTSKRKEEFQNGLNEQKVCKQKRL